MSIRVTSNLNGVEERLRRNNERAQEAVINQVYADMNRYVPFRTGDLRNQSQVTTDRKSIRWNTPYARRLFYNPSYNFRTPGTGAHWDELAKAVHLRSWQRVVERAYSE